VFLVEPKSGFGLVIDGFGVWIEEWFCGILFGMVGAILWVNLVRNSGFVVAVCAGMDYCCWKIYWR
jgi:hypothetical protein